MEAWRLGEVGDLGLETINRFVIGQSLETWTTYKPQAGGRPDRPQAGRTGFRQAPGRPDRPQTSPRQAGQALDRPDMPQVRPGALET